MLVHMDYGSGAAPRRRSSDDIRTLASRVHPSFTYMFTKSDCETLPRPAHSRRLDRTFEDVGPFVRASTANPRKPAAVAPTLLSVLSSVVCVEDAGPASRSECRVVTRRGPPPMTEVQTSYRQLLRGTSQSECDLPSAARYAGGARARAQALPWPAQRTPSTTRARSPSDSDRSAPPEPARDPL